MLLPAVLVPAGRCARWRLLTLCAGSQLRANRAPALEQLRQLIASGDFAGISVVLVLAPFDDLRQACYFLPWCVRLPQRRQSSKSPDAS
jgi:hypothetical protein